MSWLDRILDKPTGWNAFFAVIVAAYGTAAYFLLQFTRYF